MIKAWSLGRNCETASNLRRRDYVAGPLDWFETPIKSVIALLENEFAEFMEERNLKVCGRNHRKDHYKVIDQLYFVVSVHDFPINFSENSSYHEFRAKLQRRIKRFHESMRNDWSVLFVRAESQYDSIDVSEIASLIKLLDQLREGRSWRLLYIYKGSDRPFPRNRNVIFWKTPTGISLVTRKYGTVQFQALRALFRIMQYINIKNRNACCKTCGVDLTNPNNFKYLGIVVKHRRSSKELCECLNHHRFWIRYDIYDDQGHIHPEMFTGDPNDNKYSFWQSHFSEEQKKHMLEHFLNCEICQNRLNEETLIDGWFADLVHSSDRH